MSAEHSFMSKRMNDKSHKAEY